MWNARTHADKEISAAKMMMAPVRKHSPDIAISSHRMHFPSWDHLELHYDSGIDVDWEQPAKGLQRWRAHVRL